MRDHPPDAKRRRRARPLGGLLAAAIAFAPSFTFVLLGAERFDRLRHDANAGAFLDRVAPAAIGEIAGAAVTLAEAWQFAVLALATIALLALHRGVL